MSKILCVRIQRGEIIAEAIKELKRAHGNAVTFEYVNPQTPEELDALAAAEDVVAIYLQEQPLPINQIMMCSSGDPAIKPCVRYLGTGLQQVTGISVTGVPYTK